MVNGLRLVHFFCVPKVGKWFVIEAILLCGKGWQMVYN